MLIATCNSGQDAEISSGIVACDDEGRQSFSAFKTITGLVEQVNSDLLQLAIARKSPQSLKETLTNP